MESKVRFADEKVKKSFEKLKQSKGDEERLYSWLINSFEIIEKNAFCGIQIPKKLIPKQYLKKYKIHNLWKYNLPKGWRLLYSVENQEIIVVAIVLEWMKHKEYERRFKY